MMEAIWNNFDRVVVFDTETTGIEFGTDCIIQLGAVSLEKGVETDVKEIKADVKTITEKPGKRWDTLIDRVLYALLGAAVSLLAAGGQL